MRGYINKHNMKMMGEQDDGIGEQECNCQRVNCPRPGVDPGMNSRTRNTIYKARIIYDQNDYVEEKNYIGATAQELKDRVAFHRSCNRNVSREKATELTKEAHRLQRNGTQYTIEWEILEKSASIRPGEMYCKLCISEMYWIIFRRNQETLNDLKMEPCLHKRKCMLNAIKPARQIVENGPRPP